MTQIKPPKTHVYFKRLGELLTFGKIAQACGKEVQTAEAWAREPASNENPAGTGKNNPLDCIFRLMGLAHKDGDKALTREMAEAVVAYADWLDGIEPRPEGTLTELIGAAIKEHSEAIVEALNLPTKPNYAKAMTEIVQAEIALHELKKTVRNQMYPVRKLAADAVANGKNGRG